MWIEREISSKIKQVVSSFPAIILTGARQVGKTSLLKRLYPNYSFVTLDLPSTAELAEKQPEEFLKRYPPPLIIDEVQYAPNLFRYLKIEIDKNREDYGRFILTGSQKFSLMKNVSDSLAGRCAILELETLSMSEIILASNSCDNLDVIVKGGFPELQSRAELNREIFFQSYIATYLERDVRSLLNVGQLRDFERFLRACALRTGQILSKSELARDVGVSPTTANEWLSVLQISNQILLLEPWFNNKTKTLVKSPKLYFADTGLLSFLVGINNVDEFLRSPLRGSLWEAFVFSEIRKQQIFKHGKWDVWMWRDNRGLEVDFLLHQGGKFKLIEVKLTETPDVRDAEKLKKIAELIGLKLVEKIVVVSQTKNSYPIMEGIYNIPIAQIADLI